MNVDAGEDRVLTTAPESSDCILCPFSIVAERQAPGGTSGPKDLSESSRLFESIKQTYVSFGHGKHRKLLIQLLRDNDHCWNLDVG